MHPKRGGGYISFITDLAPLTSTQVLRRRHRRPKSARATRRLHILLTRSPAFSEPPTHTSHQTHRQKPSTLKPTRSNPMASPPPNRPPRPRRNPRFRIHRVQPHQKFPTGTNSIRAIAALAPKPRQIHHHPLRPAHRFRSRHERPA